LRRLRVALPLALVVLLTDCTTKELVVESLAEHTPHSVAGDVVRFTLAYNSNAAMGIPIGSGSRWPLVAVMSAVLTVFVVMLWRSPPQAAGQRVALGLLIGGAAGNLLSRVLTPQGVVDFIDIGFGSWRCFIFNVADIGIFCGACLLAWTLWRQEVREAPRQDAAA